LSLCELFGIKFCSIFGIMANSLEERHGRTRILAEIDAAVVFKIFVRR
jgi:hypothetical protein